MEQEKFMYSGIMSLGFKEQLVSDKAYFDQYGYEYSMITKYLTKKIYLDWVKETQLCELIRIDNDEEMNIKGRLPIRDIDHLNEIIDFFSDEQKQTHDYSTVA